MFFFPYEASKCHLNREGSKIKPNYLTFCLFKLCTNVRFLIHFVTLEVVPTFGGTVTLQPNFFGLMLLVRTDGLTLGRTVTSKPNYF